MSAQTQTQAHAGGWHTARSAAGLACAASLGAALSLAACRSPQPPATIPEPEPVGAEPVFIEDPTPRVVRSCDARTPAGAAMMIPASMPWIARVSPLEVMRSQLWRVLGRGLASEAQFQQLSGGFAECGLPFERIEDALFGFDDGADRQLVLVLRGPGVGHPDFATCLMAKLDYGEAELSSLPNDPSVQLLDTPGANGFVFHPDLLVLSEGIADEEILARSRCEGAPAMSSSFAPILSQIDTSAPMWLATRISAQMKTDLSSLLGVDPDNMFEFGLSMRVDSGIRLGGALTMSDPETATNAASQLSSFSGMLVSMAPPQLQAAAQRMVIESRESTVFLGATLTPDELDEVAQLMPPP